MKHKVKEKECTLEDIEHVADATEHVVEEDKFLGANAFDQ